MVENLISLNDLTVNESGIINNVIDIKSLSDEENFEIKAKLFERGFIPGALVKVLHFGGLFSKDPIAIRIGNQNSILAIRKNEAKIILVKKVKENNGID